MTRLALIVGAGVAAFALGGSRVYTQADVTDQIGRAHV